MAATDAKVFPASGVAFRVHFCIRNSTTGNPLTGGLTGLAGKISKDGAAFAATTNVPVEIGTTGYGYLDLTAAEMTMSGGIVGVTATNTSAIEWSKEVVTGGANGTGFEYLDEAGITNLTERKMLSQLWGAHFNRHTITRASGLQKVFLRDGSTVMLSGLTTVADNETVKGVMT
jgi:hypothetical protein